MLRALIAASLVALAPGLASAAPVTAQTAENVLVQNGMTDIVFYPGEGDSVGVLEGYDPNYDVTFSIRLMRCDDGIACSTVLMFANFDLERTAQTSDYIDVNSYNDTYPFGRAYVYEYEDGSAAIGVDYTVDLEDENVFGQNEVMTFGIILGSFMDHIVARAEGQ